jgi:uncharacterized glyoxalase superfamily protein PhnB
VKLSGHATVLLVDDVGVAVEYYRDALGFEAWPWEEDPEQYGYARRDNCYLHFAHYAGGRPNSVAAPSDMFDAYVWVDDPDLLHAEVAERGADVIQPPVDQDYGLREFRVRDPHGYILAFGRSL